MEPPGLKPGGRARPQAASSRRRRSDIATLRLGDEPRLNLVEGRYIAVEVMHDGLVEQLLEQVLCAAWRTREVHQKGEHQEKPRKKDILQENFAEEKDDEEDWPESIGQESPKEESGEEYNAQKARKQTLAFGGYQRRRHVYERPVHDVGLSEVRDLGGASGVSKRRQEIVLHDWP